MKPKLLLRIASGLMLFHVVGHSFGIATWNKTTDPIKQIVVDQMSQHRFPFMGSVRSLADSFVGFGYAATISMLLVVFLLWAISSRIKGNESLVKALLAGIAIYLFGWAVDEFFFFFPFATVISLLSAIFTSVAFFSIGKHLNKK
jgi:hypothetical protein